MRPATIAIIVVPIALIGLGWLAMSWFAAQERAYVRSEQILSRTSDAHTLTLVTLESERATTGRYPEKLTEKLFPNPAFQWYYRATEDGLDYELWCTLPSKTEGLDVLIFSPDEDLEREWPADRTDQGSLWRMIEGSHRTPKDLWKNQHVPDAVLEPGTR